MSQTSGWTLDREIPSVAENGVALISEVVDKMKTAEWPEHDLFGIHMALEEAIMNAIKHGNQSDPAKQVQVRCHLNCEKLEIEISDQGQGFDRSQVPDPTDDENLEKPSGRGLMLMEFYMSEVHFNERGNTVRMLKNKGQEPSLTEADQGDD